MRQNKSVLHSPSSIEYGRNPIIAIDARSGKPSHQINDLRIRLPDSKLVLQPMHERRLALGRVALALLTVLAERLLCFDVALLNVDRHGSRPF
jgi:hypothetical protein